MDPTIDEAAPRPPAPKSPLRGLTVLIPGFVLLATAATILWSAKPLLMPAREVRVAQAVFDRSAVAVQHAADTTSRARNVPTVQAAGWLEAEPYIVACTALADGVVESIHVLEGEYIEAGAVVAKLVAADSQLRVKRAEADFADSRAALTHAQAELAAATANWDEPIELERVVETRQAALAEAQAELAQLPSLVASAKATLARLEEEYKQVEGLERRQASTAIEVVIARQRVEMQRAEVRAVEARGPILEARADRLKADVRAAKRDLSLRITDRRRVDTAKAATASAEAAVMRAEAQRDEAKLELDRMVIRAPISGYVQRRLKTPGDKVMLGMDGTHSAHLVHLYDPSRIQVRVDVPLADAAHVYVGQPCEVVVEVLPDRVFRGKVLRSTHEADLQKNTLQFKVQVIDPDPVLRPEMLTRVKFLPRGTSSESPGRPSQSNNSRVLVPRAAVDNTGDQPRVWVVTNRRADRGDLIPVPVQVVEARGEWLLVSGDVHAGAIIAIDFSGAQPGERVAIHREQTGGDA